MATRLKEWMIPYTWWTGIEITDNHVINVLLRELNNLIHVNGDNELYVDLQLDDWILPDDDFPVGVTTGKILQADWWTQSWIILNWKTTSWDYVRFIYANDGKLYYDPWTWTWIEIWTWWWGGVQINVATASTLWIIKLGSDTQQTESAVTATSISGRTYPVQLNADNQAVVNIPRTDTTYTAWANIVIDQNNVISTTIPQALVYKGSVNGLSDLPASWTVWDTYFVEWEDWMYSWDWTQWSYVWGTGIDVSDLFNKTIDDSDDIVQGSTHLFVTQTEKNYWNAKQDTLTEWNWIDITNNVVSNTLPFEPENTGGLGQFLKKTNSGYAWANVPSWWSWFNPENTWTAGQVLTKTNTGYAWLSSSTESNVKCFNFPNFNSATQSEIKAVVDWLESNSSNGAIINTQAQDVYLYSYKTPWATTTYTFFSYRNRTTINTSSPNGDFTTLQQVGCQITYDGTTYTIANVDFNPVTNFLVVESSNYTTPYMPTAWYQPATKAYVDSINWTGTLSEYNALQSIDPDVVYNITSLT